MRLLLSIAFVVTISTTSHVKAAVLDGNTLLDTCDSQGAKHDGAFCYGYVAGVFDALGERAVNICTPGIIPLRQTRDVILKYLRDNPERRQESAAKLATEALSAAWPCL